MAQALLMTFLWSTSFIITKWIYALGVQPMGMAGLRYAAASLALLPIWWLQRRRQAPSRMAVRPGSAGVSLRPRWWVFLLLGLTGFTCTQGGIATGLYFLPGNTVSLILAVNNTLQVLLWSGILIREWPGRLQAVCLAAAVGGMVLYTFPWQMTAGIGLGLPPLLVAGVGYALWTVTNRRWLLGRETSALDLTLAPMAWGSAGMLALALVFEGPPPLVPAALGWIAALALVNTAFAFTVWTRTQRHLRAYESVVINNTMTIQVPLLTFWLLGEPLRAWQWLAILLVAVATALVHLAPELERRRGQVGIAAGR